ncbi:hypothetical protein IJ182_04035 [bacterium]|nr:hypothetical protein [bacterium]
MKKSLVILIILAVVNCSALAKTGDKLDVDNAGFMELGRYIETFETNDEADDNTQEINNQEEEIFEEEAIEDITKRYEANAIELKLDNNYDETMQSFNNTRIYKLRVNEDQYNIENSIKAENMIWDSSKMFTQAFLSNTRHLAPIPSVVNSSKLNAKLNKGLSASLGQTNLYDANGPSVLFIRANESTYNTGSVITYKNDGINLSVGSFSSSFNHAASGGFVISSDAIKLPYNAGNFIVGGGYFANEFQGYDKTTGGGFVEYSYKRLKLNAQVGESKFSNSEDYYTSLYFIPEFKLTDSLYLKTRFIRNITQETMQDELALTYRPKNNNNNLEFEINTSNQYTQNDNINRRIKFSTSFKI